MNVNIGKVLLTGVKIVKRGCGIVFPIIGTVVCTDLVKDIYNDIRYRGEVGYDDAVRAILDSNMFSANKQDAISVLKTGESSEYYKAVIIAARSSMFSYDRFETIRSMSERNEEGSQA